MIFYKNKIERVQLAKKKINTFQLVKNETEGNFLSPIPGCLTNLNFNNVLIINKFT